MAFKLPPIKKSHLRYLLTLLLGLLGGSATEPLSLFEDESACPPVAPAALPAPERVGVTDVTGVLPVSETAPLTK